MEIFITILLVGFALNAFIRRDQGVRIALLGAYLAQYQIETLMANLIQGYLRALGEADPERQASIWSNLKTSEVELCRQFNAFVLSFAKVGEPQARVSKLPFALPYAAQWWPGHTFDVRKVLAIHAKAITMAATESDDRTRKQQAFTMMAELFLMQHTCHWYCRSRLVASARLMAQHKSPYAQVLDSVAPQTRQAYCAVVGR